MSAPDETISEDRLPTVADIRAAAGRLAGHAVVTPLLSAPLLDRQVGGRLLIKPEMLQLTGSFKFRGAYNRLVQIPAALRGRGAVAYSSGNHAQGVAAAAAMLGMPATIIMPADAPAAKRRGTEAWGATVLAYDRYREVREAIGAEIAARTGAVLVPPYDDRDVIAGQGTIGLEIVAQCTERGIRPDAVLVSCGGGGLVAGTSLAVKEAWPDVAVYAVEPESFDDTRRSLAAGAIQANAAGAQTLCDALQAPQPGNLTFAINRRTLAGGIAVGEAAVLDAMAVAFSRLKLVMEPGGAVPLAAVLSGAFQAEGRTVVLVCSGGNVDPPLFARALQRGAGEG